MTEIVHRSTISARDRQIAGPPRRDTSLTCLAICLAFATCLLPGAVAADPFPPNWNGGAGAHFAPAPWPADDGDGALDFGDWIPYTYAANDTEDQAVQDPSNGGTSPQNYANVSSGCTDLTLPSIFYTYDSGTQTFFFRWRVEQIANTYATGPNAGEYSSTDPWKSALWTVFFDIDGDGYREFAFHIDGSSGEPGEPIDELVSIYSDTPSQSIDYVNDPEICRLYHNPTAFVDDGSVTNTGRLLNFRNSVSPSASWPNGAAEAVWDYGTTRSRKVTHATCTEYFIDYQIPLAMLDATASACGGPAVTESTPMSLSFATANSLNDPLQKDVVFQGTFTTDTDEPVPGGDVITPGGDAPQQPTVTDVTATGCGPATLTAQVMDYFDVVGGSVVDTIASVDFYAYEDSDGNGVADDGSSWSLIASGSPTATLGQWTATWDSTGLPASFYLIGVRAQDDEGNVTWSHLTQAEADALGSPPNYANSSGVGVVTASFVNTCGTSPSLTKSASVSEIGIGGFVDFTLTVTADTIQPLSLTSLTDVLPAGWTHDSTVGGTLTPSTSPAGGASGNVVWTFAPATSIPAGTSATLIFRAQAPLSTGSFTNSATAATSQGTLESNRVPVNVGAPRLTIAKSVDQGSASPGATLVYTITYSNDSPINVTGATIVDTLPTGVTFVSATGGGVHDGGSPGTVTWNVGTLNAGAGPFSVQVTVTVDDPLPAGTANPLVNSATIDSTESDPASDDASTFVSLPLAIQKRAAVAQVTPGTDVTYTIDYANTGGNDALLATITDVVPAGFTYRAASCPQCTSITAPAVGGTGTVTYNLGTVAAGTGGSVTLTLRPNNPYGGTIPATNTATFAASGVTPISDTHQLGITQLQATCPTSVLYFRNQQTNVGLAGTRYIANTTAPTATTETRLPSPIADLPTTFVELGRFYSDPALTEVAVHDGNVTAAIHFLKSNGPKGELRISAYDYDPASGALGFQIGSSVSGIDLSGNGFFVGNFSFTANGIIQEGHRILWVVEGRSQNNNNIAIQVLFDSVTFPSRGSICLSPLDQVLEKNVDSLAASPGDPLTYTLRFGNTGRAAINNATIADTLPDGVTFSSATLNGVAVAPSGSSGQTYTFSVQTSDNPGAGILTANANGALVITATVDSPFNASSNVLVNSATLTSDEADPATAAASTTVTQPNLTIEKAASETLVQVGDTVTYSLAVSNFGNAAATGVEISDVLPATAYYIYDAGSCAVDTTDAPSTTANCSVTSPNLAVSADVLPAGDSLVVSYSMTVQPGAPAGLTELDNTAQVYDDLSGPGNPTDSNTVIVTVSTAPNLQIDLSTTSTSPLATGEVVTYTIVVSNSGSGDALDVVVSNPIPANTTYVPGTLTYEGGGQTDANDGDLSHFAALTDELLWAIGTLPAGTSRTMTFQVVVDSVLPAGTTLFSDTATADSSNAGQRTDTVDLTAEAAPAWSLLKSAPSQLPFPLTLLNGNQTTPTTTLNVDSSSLISVGDVIAIQGSSAVATVTGLTATTVTVDTPLSGGNNAEVRPAIEYTVRYTNTGDAPASGVVLTDALPTGTVFASASDGGVHDGGTPGTVTWTVAGTVEPGEAAIFDLVVVPTATGSYENDFVVASNELADQTSNTTTTSVGALVPSKSTSTPNVTNSPSGSSASYTLTVVNDSGTTATNLTLTDTFESGFTFSSNTSISGGTRTTTTNPTAGDNPATWCCWTLADGATLTINFVAAISDQVGDGTYQNALVVSSDNVAALEFDELETTAEDVTVDYTGPNHVVVSWFEAYADGDDVVLRWETDAEVGTVGFHVLRQDPATGLYEPVHQGLLTGLLTAPQGGVYSLVDRGAAAAGLAEASYMLVELEASGQERSYGPMRVAVAPSREVLGLPEDLAERKPGRRYGKLAHPLEGTTPGPGMLGEKAKPTGAALSGVRIGITADGVYRLGAADIAAVLGDTAATVEKLIRQGRLRLTTGDEAVSWRATADGKAILFYAEGTDSNFSRERTYLLAAATKGHAMVTADGTPSAAASGQTFRDTRRFEQDALPLVLGSLDPAGELWFWDFVIGNGPAKTISLDLENPVVTAADIELAIGLQGATASGSSVHRVHVELNGHALGSVDLAHYTGEVAHFTAPAAFLFDGANAVTLRAERLPGVVSSIVVVDHFAVTYDRGYETSQADLALAGGGHANVTVSGLPEAGALVLDVSTPRRPRLLEGVVATSGAGGHAVRFASPSQRYFLATPSAIAAPASLAPDYASDLLATNHRVDYLVIAPTALADAAERLADLRRARGLDALVVTVDDVMDEINGGQRDPAAIRDFLAWTLTEWQRGPRYVALVGEGHYDYREVQTSGTNLVPPLLAAAQWGLYASDNRLADVDDDGRPDVAIGRLPVTSPAALDAYVAKLAAYEAEVAAGAGWSGQALVVADNPDATGDYIRDSDGLAAQLGAAVADRIYLGPLSTADVHARLVSGLGQGAGLVTYLGHAGVSSMAHEGILRSADVASLANGERSPVMALMACHLGNFAIPGSASLAERLVVHDAGGATAVWTAAGISYNPQRRLLAELFIERLQGSSGTAVLGDLVLGALHEGAEHYGAAGRELVESQILLGDPALLVAQPTF